MRGSRGTGKASEYRKGIPMTIGFVLLIITGLIVLFGAGQRCLDRLRLTDRQALLFIGLIIAGGFVPDIRVTELFYFNIGGALIPLILCIWLFVKADTGKERVRCIAGGLLTAAAVFMLGRLLPDEPDSMVIDPNYAYGIAAGLIGYGLGRSRRGAFFSGVTGVMLAHTANAVYVWSRGAEQRLVLGGAGSFDVIVMSGFIALALAELVGEMLERIRRGRRRPVRDFINGDFVTRREQDK